MRLVTLHECALRRWRAGIATALCWPHMPTDGALAPRPSTHLCGGGAHPLAPEPVLGKACLHSTGCGKREWVLPLVSRYRMQPASERAGGIQCEALS